MDARSDPAVIRRSGPASDSRQEPDPRPWDPLTAWRFRNLYGSIVAAIRAVLPSSSSGPARVLQIGGHSRVVGSWLAIGDRAIPAEVLCVPHAGDRLPDTTGIIDCVVAIDWLPAIAASQRERAVHEACRLARHGVIFVNAFDSPRVRSAARTINDLYRAVHDVDHPRLGRPIEIGFPDASVVQSWLEHRFPFVTVSAVDEAIIWQTSEAIALTRDEIDAPGAISDSDISAAAAYPLSGDAVTPASAFRMAIVASRSETTAAIVPEETGATWPAAIAIHHAVEAAAQRRSLDALVAAVTTERDREREEFRGALASLAQELRDLDAKAEFLTRELRSRDQLIGNQDAQIASQQALLAAAESKLAAPPPTEVVVVADPAAVAELEALRAHLADLHHDADAYRRFLNSRAGRALGAYTRLKNVFRRS